MIDEVVKDAGRLTEDEIEQAETIASIMALGKTFEEIAAMGKLETPRRVVVGLDIGRDLCKALRLEAQQVLSVNINVPGPDDAVVITATMHADDQQMNDIIEIIKKYKLVHAG